MVMLVPFLSNTLWRAALGAFLTFSCLSSQAFAMEREEEAVDRKPNKKGHNVRWGKNTEFKIDLPSQDLNNNNVLEAPQTGQMKPPWKKSGTQLRRGRSKSMDSILLDENGEQKIVSPHPSYPIIYGFTLDTGPANKSDVFDESLVSSTPVVPPTPSLPRSDPKDTKMGEADESLQFSLDLHD